MATIQGVCKKNKSEIALWFCKASHCTNLFLEIGC